MGQVLFIVWRESVEAMLVIGILYAWLKAHPEAGAGMRYLWGGVAAGIAAALALGGAILAFAEFFAGDAQDWFQIAMVLAAALLIVHMVFWMKRHGRTLKHDLEAGMARTAVTANWWGMLVLVMLAVAREGSETVIFLYGLGLAQQGIALLQFTLAALAGFALALATFGLLQLGGKVFSWRAFFRFSETVLLLLAASLLVTGAEKLVALGWLPPLLDPLWHSAWLLDDSAGLGGLIAALTGYRAQPALITVLLYAGYWVVIGWLSRRSPPAVLAQVRPAGT
ncbi:MAG TPA: FTR1 family protein [Candidatus Competibacteraceae bacterium]|nr:FTR1 family protein [Candidatus Competibacteraceae bacterium]